MKQASEKGPALNTRHAYEDLRNKAKQAHEGMHRKASRRSKNLIRPMELGRQRKAASIAQAKRDER